MLFVLYCKSYLVKFWKGFCITEFYREILPLRTKWQKNFIIILLKFQTFGIHSFHSFRGMTDLRF